MTPSEPESEQEEDKTKLGPTEERPEVQDKAVPDPLGLGTGHQ